MKKFVILTLSIVLLFSLVACGQTGIEEEENLSSAPHTVSQGTGQEDGDALLYAGGDDLDSVLSGFDQKYFDFVKDGISSVELTLGQGNFGIHIFAGGITLEDAKTQMESIFGIAFEPNDGAYLFNDAENATVYILDVSDVGIYIRYDFFDGQFVEEIENRGYYSIIESTVPEISDEAVEVAKTFALYEQSSSEVYIAYEYPQEKLTEIWDDYQQKLSEFDNYELVEDDGQRGVVVLDNGLIIETSVDTGWGRMFVTLGKAVKE